MNNGQLYFGNDLYNRDDKLVPIVMSGAMPSKEVVTRFRRCAESPAPERRERRRQGLRINGEAPASPGPPSLRLR